MKAINKDLKLNFLRIEKKFELLENQEVEHKENCKELKMKEIKNLIGNYQETKKLNKIIKF